MMQLSVSQLTMVGGTGNFADKSTGGRVDSNSNGGCGGAPKSCANDVGAAAIIGAILGIPAGPAGMIAGAVGTGVVTGIGSCNNSPYNRNSNSSGGPNYGGQCNW
ncbi:hypothetical protein [Pantoea sp. BAV 3049]|uniref:hypothetical protein n=1 Tax=Pantoea sp. BAV 3049 TaxID=2654188 RepID=UPI00351B5B7C